jgi:hypothetical protein
MRPRRVERIAGSGLSGCGGGGANSQAVACCLAYGADTSPRRRSTLEVNDENIGSD